MFLNRVLGMAVCGVVGVRVCREAVPCARNTLRVVLMCSAIAEVAARESSGVSSCTCLLPPHTPARFAASHCAFLQAVLFFAYRAGACC